MSTEDHDTRQRTTILEQPSTSDNVASEIQPSVDNLSVSLTDANTRHEDLFGSRIYTGETVYDVQSEHGDNLNTRPNVEGFYTYTDSRTQMVVSETYSEDSSLFPVLLSNNDPPNLDNDDDNIRDANLNALGVADIENHEATSSQEQNVNAPVRLEELSNDTVIVNNEEGSSDNLSLQNEDSAPANLDRCRKSDSPPGGPPAKIRKVESEEVDGETCPICLEPWGSSGDHRLVVLKCGHLFGANCVVRWLKAQPLKARCCPTCKSKATMKDIRNIYAKRVIMQDTSQITELQEKVTSLELELQKKNKVELEFEKLKIAYRACQLERDVLRSTLMKNQIVKEPVRKQWRFSLEKNLQICREGGCRVLTYNCRTYELYVSQKSMNNLFPGYGIRKVSCLDYKLGQFVHLHPKPIRDMTYSQPRDLLLSVGLDSTARIVERGIPSITINTGMPLWSCSWDYLRTNEFYVGGVGGLVHQYDFRNPSTYLQCMRNAVDISPVASLCSTEYGLLTSQLNSSWLWVSSQRQWEQHALPVDGSFTSLCYDNESHRALLCTRPNTSTMEKAKLTLCRLKSGVQGEVMVDVEETFNGTSRSSLMSRATWVKAPGSSWIASHSESDSALLLHGLDGANTMMLHAAEPAIDVCSLQLNGNTLLAALSESRLRIYKAVASS